MIRYYIYTENKNLELIKSVLNANLDSYSIQEQIGVWKGKEKKSLKIEILGRYQDDNIRYIACTIKTLNSQESVPVTCERIEEIFGHVE
jgi:hypothetical protein